MSRFLLASLVILAGCRRDTVVCTGYDPVRGNCYDTSLDLDDARVMAVDGASLPAGPSPCHAPVLVRVTNVRDGDTLDVLGVSDTSFMGGVRLIGVDAPEIEHPPTPADCFGNEARVFTQQLDERLVWLTFDGECMDPYDRWLAYAYVGAGTGDLWQRQLLQRGFARTLTIPPNDAFAASFATDAMAAEGTPRGLWSACVAP
jgi:endonuclease YncB( thermonuclease family)